MALIDMIRAADETFLISLANKGIYNRALRELDEAAITITANGDSATASFADGTIITMENRVQSYTCTCPSRSVCKHLIMAVLAAKAQPTAETAEETPLSPPDFSVVAEADAKLLEKLCGKKIFGSALLAIQLGEKASIDEGSVLAITLHDSGNIVRFLPASQIQDSACTCKANEFCSHRAQAVLQYIVHKNGKLPMEFTPAEIENPLEFSTAAIPYLSAFIAEVMATGLARLPEDCGGRFLQLATICHSQRLANPERLCSRIAGHLEAFAKKSAEFNRDYLLSDLCELMLLCERIADGGGREDVGVFRETYRPVSALEIWGLGAYGWHSAGGYTGVTMLFFSPDEKIILTSTTALPDDSAPSAVKLYESGAPWGLPLKLAAISHARFALKGAKLSEKGQISSSEQTAVQPLGATNPIADELADLRFTDFAKLLEAVWQRMESGGDSFYAIIKPARLGVSDFDNITQQWSLPVYDSAERRLTLQIHYEEATKRLLENMMDMEKQNLLGGDFLVRALLKNGRLVAFPITHYGEKAFNLSLDKEKLKNNTKRPLWFI